MDSNASLSVLLPTIGLSVALYVYYAYSLQTIAKKTGTPNGWFAWVPLLNMLLMLRVAEKPGWWLVLAFIPFVNIVWVVLAIIVWMRIAEVRGFASWWGIMMIVPVVQLVVPGYLAFGEGGHVSHGTPAAHH